jgi:hypothetical protein
MKKVIDLTISSGAPKRLAAVLALALAGCAGAPVHTGSEVIPVQWIVHESQNSLNTACGYNPTRIQSTASMRAVRTSSRFAKVNGCFKQPIPGGLCTIHTMKMPHAEEITAEASDFFETFGHESAHCFVGRFHK